MRLRRTQICSIHHSRFCCGREAFPKERRIRQCGSAGSTIRITLAVTGNYGPTRKMRKLMNRKIALQHGKYPLCREKFIDYSNVVPDHISPRGMRGAWRDDHPDNIQAVH